MHFYHTFVLCLFFCFYIVFINMDTEEFIKRSKEIHGDKYNYLNTVYKKAKDNVKIICPEHGEFEQTPDSHIYKKSGCKFCAKNVKYTKEDIIKKFKDFHGDKYDYSLVDYKGVFKKVKILCEKHGVFEQGPKCHFSGSGCPNCAGKNLTKEQIIEKLKEIHGNLYDYSKTIPKRVKDKITIICKKHGEFSQTLDGHKNGKGCKKCNMSKGEQKIKTFLKELKIKFVYQKVFNDCINPETGKLLIFDFFLPDYNLCVEYDGEQHYLPMRFSKRNNITNLEKIQKRDLIKTNFCKKSNLKLLRIKYTDLKEIDNILIENINIS